MKDRVQSSHSPNQPKLKKKFPGQLTHASHVLYGIVIRKMGTGENKDLGIINMTGQVP